MFSLTNRSNERCLCAALNPSSTSPHLVACIHPPHPSPTTLLSWSAGGRNPPAYRVPTRDDDDERELFFFAARFSGDFILYPRYIF